MPLRLFWDASGVAKRYIEEPGTEAVNALFEAVPLDDMAVTLLSCAETYPILGRKRNTGALSLTQFAVVSLAFRNELMSAGGVQIVAVSDAQILGAFGRIDRQNLNATDAILLVTLAELRQQSGQNILLVASDVRLIRAATAEGVACLNPEAVLPGDVPALLAAL